MSATDVDVRVKVADYAVRRGELVLTTIGLGSCVAIALYDRDAHVGGLAHILLPSQSMSRRSMPPGTPIGYTVQCLPNKQDDSYRHQ